MGAGKELEILERYDISVFQGGNVEPTVLRVAFEISGVSRVGYSWNYTWLRREENWAIFTIFLRSFIDLPLVFSEVQRPSRLL